MEKDFIKNRYAAIRCANNISARKLSFELGQSSEYINQIENVIDNFLGFGILNQTVI